MSIDFSKIAGAPKDSKTNRADLPKAQYWLNIGYSTPVIVEVNGEQVEENRFISLPVGIPLDTQEHKARRGSSAEYLALVDAQNNLLDMLMAEAQKLDAGGEEIVNLQIQLRRVKDETAPVSTDKNPFIPTAMQLVG